MSGWHKHSGGIFTEFKVSIILAEMIVILEFIMTGINSLLLSQFTLTTFMDDFFLMLPSLSKTKDLLICISLALSYERISVKASKSTSLVIVSGKIVHDKSLCIVLGANHQAIPSIVESPSEVFGKSYFRCSVRQVSSRQSNLGTD